MDSQTQTAPQVGTMLKADLGKRVAAVAIDSVGISIIAGILSPIPVLNIIGALLPAAYMLTRDGFDFEFMDRRSIGKKLMKIRPVRLDGQPMDLMGSIARNWPFLVPIVPLIGFFIAMNDPQGMRIGDKVANTIVVDDA